MCRADPSWVEQQTRAYTAWVNSYLDDTDEHVDNLFVDFADGLRIVHLLELLEERRKEQTAVGENGEPPTPSTPGAVPSPFTNIHKNPKLKFHKIEK